MSLIFLSTRNRGVTPDLRLIEANMREKYPSNYKYFVNAENSKNKMYGKSSKIGRKNMVTSDDDIISIDGSLPGGMKFGESSVAARVLIPIEYDFQFKQLMTPAEKKRSTFNAYTHILSPSPLTTRLLEEQYEKPEGQTVEPICAPFAYDLATNETQRERLYERFYRYYPAARGKKIVSVLRAGKYDEEAPEPIQALDLNRFLDTLGEDCFVITNVFELLNRAALLKNERKNAFCFVNGLMKNDELLYITDVLISNHSYLLSAFAARKKPMYILQYKEKGVELYLKAQFPSLLFEDYDEIAARIRDGEYSEDHKRMNTLLSYSPKENPIDKLLEIFD